MTAAPTDAALAREPLDQWIMTHILVLGTLEVVAWYAEWCHQHGQPIRSGVFDSGELSRAVQAAWSERTWSE